MRKKLIKSLLFIVIIMFIILIVLGLHDEDVGIKSYIELQQKTKKSHINVQELQEKSTSEYKAKKQALIEAVNEYKKKKEEYENLIPIVQGVSGINDRKFDLYDIDFLWTIIGNYATEEGVVIQFDVAEVSKDITFEDKDYVLCNLNFTVTGEYAAIVNFIYDLEDDDRLHFEIRDFELKKMEENLQATFIVNSAPINQKNLSIITENDIIDKENVEMKNNEVQDVENSRSNTMENTDGSF